MGDIFRLARWIALGGLLLPVLICAQPSVSSEVLKIKDDFERQALGRYVTVLTCAGKPSLARVMRDSINYPFQANLEAYVRLVGGKRDTGYWLRIALHNDTEQIRDLVLELDNPLIEEIEFFEVTQKIDLHNYTGLRFAFGTRRVNHRNFVYKLKIRPTETKQYYIYIAQQGRGVHIPMNLYTQDAFAERNSQRQLYLGLMNGVMMFATGLALFLYVRLWQRIIFYLFLYLATLWLFHANANGLAFQYLWTHAEWWSPYAHYLLAYANAFVGARLLFFLTLDYNVPPHWRRAWLWITYIIAVLGSWAMLMVYFDSSWIIFFIGWLPIGIFCVVNVVLYLVGLYLMSAHSSLSMYLSVVLMAMAVVVNVYLWWNLPETVNFFDTGFFHTLTASMTIALWLMITHRGRYFRTEEELEKVISLNRLIAINEQKVDNNNNTQTNQQTRLIY